MPRKKHPELEWLEPWLELNALADLAELPEEWLVCPMCAQFSWRLPPHGFHKPCPLATGVAESTGMKLDAERMTAVRAGVHLEQMSKAMRQYMAEQELREEDDDDDQ